MTPRRRMGAATIAAACATAIGVLAAWPIYQTWALLIPAAIGLIGGAATAALAVRRRWSALTTALVLIGFFIITVVPVAVPSTLQQLPLGPLRGVLDGTAAVVLGWKQLLTLTLPVGSYHTMLAPAYIVFLVAAFFAVRLAGSSRAVAMFAAIPLLMPIAFGTVFGSSVVSDPMRVDVGNAFTLQIAAPREIGLWLAAVALGALWVVYSAGTQRRAALRLGRAEQSRQGAHPRSGTAGRAARAAFAAVPIVVAVLLAIVLAPLVTGEPRQVPRDQIDPEVVIRERPSPLAGYRATKQNDEFAAELFTVTAEGETPDRLRLAVLEAYDGVDFHVGGTEADRFTRFPSGAEIEAPSTITVTIEGGYGDIWVPATELGSAPGFTGPRAGELADAFYVNRNTHSAIAVPGGAGTIGLQPGDGFTAVMSAAADGVLSGAPPVDPARETPGIDRKSMPELTSWVARQNVPATGEGVVELIERLRARGYLSHSLSAEQGGALWLDALAARYGTRFEPSAGGHSIARIEQLFEQLNAQERLAGEHATADQLVAAIGDDEQFAAAAALLARELGFDSRVVVGVRMAAEIAVPGVPACEQVCAGENVAAWIEVRDSDGRWVPIDVTPQVEVPPTALVEGEQLPEFPTTPEERDAREVDPPLGFGEQEERAEESEQTENDTQLWQVIRVVGLGLLALVLLMLPFAFLPIAKRLRTRWRESEPEPELRALGAWHDMLDHADDTGLDVPRTGSRSAAAHVLVTEHAARAAREVDRAVFSPTGIDAAEASAIWEAVRADRAERVARLTAWQRLRSAYSLRSYGLRFARTRRRAAELRQANRHDRSST